MTPVLSRPIPNQPVFVWQIHKTTILCRGHVQGKGGQGHHLPAYAKVIAGTQTLAALPGSIVKSTGAIQVYGYHLPAHWLLGSTRFRIPVIVHIWNLMVSGIQVLATINNTLDKTMVIATPGPMSDNVHVSYLQLSGFDTTGRMSLWFNVKNVSRQLFVICTAGLQYSYSVPLKMFAYTSDLFQRLRLQVASVNPAIEKTLKFAVSLQNYIERVFKMSVRTTGELSRVIKLSVSVTRALHVSTHKLSVSVIRAIHRSTHKLLAAIPLNRIVRIVNMSVDLVIPVVERTFKLSVHPLHKLIERAMQYFRFDVEAQWITDETHVHTQTQFVEAERPSEIRIHTLIVEHLHRTMIKAGGHIYSIKSLLIRVYDYIKKIFVPVNIYDTHKTTQLNIRSNPKLKEQIVYCPFLTEGTDGELHVHMHTEILYDEYHYLEAEVLAFIGRSQLNFMPIPAPFVHRAQCLLSLCNTSVQSYIDFYMHDAQKASKVLISSCTGTVRRLLQWYLMGGRVSNEGFGNEVIFDLGDVDPIGPIPPSPPINWGGGYVEDPFVGAGYVPAEDTTGYASPDADKWVKNVAMYWGKASEPFEEN